jgi:signal recognition particle receptor subunit beta
MPLVNHARKEIHLKVVYYGPGLGGKTTNLEFIHKHTRPDHRGKLISLMGESERTLFFDLLPMELGRFKGYRVRVHLCTVPGQLARDQIRQRVLRHVDGIVFVVDSQEGREDENLESIRNLETNLREQGDEPDRMPLVIQYNKRDLDNALSVEELRRALNVPGGVEQVEASALYGGGVFDTLKRIIKGCLHLVGDPRNAREGRSPSILPGRRPSMYPSARPPAARSTPPDGVPAGDVVVPGAPRAPSMPFEDDG